MLGSGWCSRLVSPWCCRHLTLISLTFQHVKSIQRDKKVEALIHRDFQYLLSISAKKMASKAYH
jgi:hypothetical protein